MKNIKIALITLVTTLVLSSCTDAIDIVQPGELSEDAAFQNVEDLQKGLVAVYGSIGGETEIAFNSIFTDEVSIGIGNGGQGLIDGEYSFFLNTGSDAPYVIWRQNYVTINLANRVIRAAEKIVPTDPDDLIVYKNIVAQAHIWRAYAHFKLLSYFSPDVTDDGALGVIALDFVPTIDQKLPRNTNGEVFALIDADLAYVSDLVPTTLIDPRSLVINPNDPQPYPGANADNFNRNFISADFVKALKARIAAYRGDYATAGTLADELIAAYTLTPRALFSNIWKDVPVATDEVIFRLDRVPGDGLVGGAWATVNSTAAGSPFYEASTDLYALLSLPGDIRKTAYFSTPADFDGDGANEVFPIGKYPGSGGLSFLNDIKVFRTSEMIFIKAESLAAAGDFIGVAAQLQKVNNARFTAATSPIVPVPADATAAWAAILKARRADLAYEGHRYLDLKRLGAKANVDINRDPADCAINSACFLSFTDYRFTFPIPSSETGANPNIQQNTGY